MIDVLGIGNAIVDILAVIQDDFLQEHDLSKSSMHLTSTEKQNYILKDLENLTVSSGGSVANTIATVAMLNSTSAFIGQVCEDKWGKFFDKDMRDIGVKTNLNILPKNGERASGTSIILISPDGERTMNTNLGVASSLDISIIDEAMITSSKLIYIEGYLYDSKETIQAIELAIKVGKANNAKIALSLSDAFCVDRHRDGFLSLFEDIDILFANEAEFCSLFNLDNHELSLEIIKKYINELPQVTVITQSERGCTTIENKSVFQIPGEKVENILDLTGAGDQFAAGFLHSYCKGEELSKNAEFGIKLASKIITKIGPRFTKEEIALIS